VCYATARDTARDLNGLFMLHCTDDDDGGGGGGHAAAALRIMTRVKYNDACARSLLREFIGDGSFDCH
jgi:hypothetical protein